MRILAVELASPLAPDHVLGVGDNLSGLAWLSRVLKHVMEHTEGDVCAATCTRGFPMMLTYRIEEVWSSQHRGS